jgi:hypothetical protein
MHGNKRIHDVALGDIATAGIENSYKSDIVGGLSTSSRDSRLLQHLPEQRKGLFEMTTSGIDSDHGRPGNDIFARDLAEGRLGISEATALPIHVDEAIGNRGVCGQMRVVSHDSVNAPSLRKELPSPTGMEKGEAGLGIQDVRSSVLLLLLL